ncbi:MAG: non-ribosomal peptide synthetase, partial [Gammaproteobacteria bacterium]|nr:non-ribosomal peptide synthetase [Gammaproteobacteria bacterium]
MLGGEEARATDFDLFRDHYPDTAVFINGLGPSESTTALQFHADKNTRLPGRQVPVGRAVAGTEVLLLAEDGNEAGLRGEIVIRSPYVSPGYLQQPELTARKMRAGCFYTGDLARRLPDGQLIYEGRRDAQVQLNGRRTELSEIEYALTGQQGVEQCAVMLCDSPAAHDSHTLVAVYTGAADRQALRSALRATLPAWMVPGRIVHLDECQLDELPLKANGKTDHDALRAALPLPGTADHAPAGDVPEDSDEHAIAAVYTELLAVASVGINDDFFALGGHSLLAMRLLARLESRLNVRLTLADVFAAPTPAELAAHVRNLPRQA